MAPVRPAPGWLERASGKCADGTRNARLVLPVTTRLILDADAVEQGSTVQWSIWGIENVSITFVATVVNASRGVQFDQYEVADAVGTVKMVHYPDAGSVQALEGQVVRVVGRLSQLDSQWNVKASVVRVVSDLYEFVFHMLEVIETGRMVEDAQESEQKRADVNVKKGAQNLDGADERKLVRSAEDGEMDVDVEKDDDARGKAGAVASPGEPTQDAFLLAVCDFLKAQSQACKIAVLSKHIHAMPAFSGVSSDAFFRHVQEGVKQRKCQWVGDTCIELVREGDA